MRFRQDPGFLIKLRHVVAIHRLLLGSKPSCSGNVTIALIITPRVMRSLKVLFCRDLRKMLVPHLVTENIEQVLLNFVFTKA